MELMEKQINGSHGSHGFHEFDGSNGLDRSHGFDGSHGFDVFLWRSKSIRNSWSSEFVHPNPLTIHGLYGFDGFQIQDILSP